MSCLVVKKNLGPGSCFALPQLIRGMITTPVDFKFTTANLASAAAFKAAMQAAILDAADDRIYFWPFFVGMENLSEDAVYEDTPLADIAVRDGKYRFRFMLRNNMLVHKNMYTHRGGNQRAFFIDNKGQIFGYEDEATGDFYGFELSLLNSEKLIFNDGSAATKSPVYVVLADSMEVDQSGALQDVPFIGTVKRLTDVELSDFNEDTPDTVISCQVRTKADGISVSGLVAADFLVTTAAGAAQAPDTVTYNATTERYIFTRAASFVDGFIDLDTPDNLSIQAYESLGALAVDIA